MHILFDPHEHKKQTKTKTKTKNVDPHKHKKRTKKTNKNKYIIWSIQLEHYLICIVKRIESLS